ncbi:cytochrome c peroxidase [Massilia sp. W12]|uniref:cytochrome-c peroxidase n=1 Tax=Massilia sp. W12 TaxID=3126507 RepID=UPI0030CCBF35
MKIRLSTALISLAAFGFLVTPALSILDKLPAWSSESSGPDAWSDDERKVLSSLLLSKLGPPPLDPSNKYELKPEAIALGKRLFHDVRLSTNGAVSCASCHDPAKDFQDGKALGQGLAQGNRRTMSLGSVGYHPFFFWDGRKDSLWSQALEPLENPKEHGMTRTGLLHLMTAHYKADYEKVFGALPKTEGLPQQAGPQGTPEQQDAWQSLPRQNRHEISQAFANIGKAIAAWEKTLQYTPGRVDHYIEALLLNRRDEWKVLSTSEKNGMRLFIGKAQCITCHNGPLLTDYSFHNTGVPPASIQELAAGRSSALEKLTSDPFNCLGPFSDAKADLCGELRFLSNDNPAWLAAFKTPSLRGVGKRAPYMHAGQMANLERVAAHYQKATPASIGHNERDPMQLTPSEITDLLAFLNALDSKIVENNATLRVAR